MVRAAAVSVAVLAMVACVPATPPPTPNPSLEVVDEVVLPATSFISGQPPMTVRGAVTLRNAGAAGSVLHLEVPRMSGAELCVGTFTGMTCDVWIPPEAGLAAGEAVEVPLEVRAARAGERTWVATFQAIGAGAVEREVRVRASVVDRNPTMAECLVVSPSMLSFEAARGCATPQRTFQLYNVCSTTQTVDAPELTSGGPEFEVSAQFSAGAEAVGGSPVPLVFTVRYAPLDVGADAATLRVSSREGAEVLIPLQGVGRERERFTDRFMERSRARHDFVFMIDTSPSFAPRRAALRMNLERHAGWLRAVGCVDARVALAPAEGSGLVEFARNDAGTRWSSSREAAFVGNVLSAFDALPVSSEVEACVGPAAALVTDAGVRPGSHLTGFCITDALEQSPQPQAAFASFASASDAGASWNVVAPKPPGCAEEALDDGVHGLLGANGRWADLCDADWDLEFERFGCAGGFFDGVFFLTTRPDGPIEVRVDGVLAPASDWAWSANDNTVRFVPGKWPVGGQTVEVTATAACFP